MGQLDLGLKAFGTGIRVAEAHHVGSLQGEHGGLQRLLAGAMLLNRVPNDPLDKRGCGSHAAGGPVRGQRGQRNLLALTDH